MYTIKQLCPAQRRSSLQSGSRKALLTPIFWRKPAVNRDKFEANYQDAPAHRRRHEARRYGVMVPIVVWPDGRVEQGFERNLGCFI